MIETRAETLNRPDGVVAPPSASVFTPRPEVPFQQPRRDPSSVEWDPFGPGGLYSTDPRYAWRDDAGCYALLCESCRQRWAVTLDHGTYVCLESCVGGGR